MFSMSIPWWEFVIRGVAVYAFLLFFLRISGRRQIGQYDPFDLILLLILSNAVQNSMNGGDNSLVGGMISGLTLIGCHVIMAHSMYRFRQLARWVDGKPIVLIQGGVLNAQVMEQEHLTSDDVHAALRAAGALHTYEVERATIETNGQITVVLINRDSAPSPAEVSAAMAAASKQAANAATTATTITAPPSSTVTQTAAPTAALSNASPAPAPSQPFDPASMPDRAAVVRRRRRRRRGLP